MFVEITNSVYLVYIYFELVKIYYLFVFCPYAAVVYGTDFKKFHSGGGNKLVFLYLSAIKITSLKLSMSQIR